MPSNRSAPLRSKASLRYKLHTTFTDHLAEFPRILGVDWAREV